ncbi:MAG: pilus assembly protein [Acidiferrobacterales bacterium]
MKAVHTIRSKIAGGRLTAAPRVLLAGKYCRGGLRRCCASLFAALLALVPLTSAAAPLSLANSPLFLGNSVQPNIFFMLDDSGSMRWEVLLNTGATAISGATNGISRVDFTPDSVRERAELCRGYNAVAYDPNVRYTPWYGRSRDNKIYVNADLMESNGFEEIRLNPYCPDKSGNSNCSSTNYTEAQTTSNYTIDLTDDAQLEVAYFPWNDADSDGEFDLGECGDLSDNDDGIQFDDLSSNGTATVPGSEQERNYANWLSYYRKRDYVVKRAVSELIFNSQARMGLSSIHNNDGIGTPIQDINNLTLPVNATAQANKDALLTSLSREFSSGGTPLRQGLSDVGQYYEGTTNVSWQNALFNGSPNHNTSETISTLSPMLNTANGGSCEQNFTILMSDGHWNGGSPSLGNADADGASPNAAGNTSFDGVPYADSDSNTLADVAMYYYERDLRGDLANDVPTLAGVDDNNAQHMVTFTVAFGLEGTLDPFDTRTPGDPTDTDPTDPGFVGWPTPSSNQPETLDDVWHAAYNGRGEFLSAKDPTALTAALSTAIGNIADRTGSAASVAVNSRTLNTDTTLYQARFTSGEWSGELRALPLTTAGVGAELWNAKDRLISQSASNGWDTNRNIISFDGTSGIAFRWASLSAIQQTALDTDPATTVPDGEGPARLDYLRGDPSNEGGGNNYRVRNNGFKLGDIVDSAPLYVGAPPFLPDLESVPHSSYRTAKASRREMVYVGANDGMLHGFDASTGDEKIAYVPNMVFANLNELTNQGYVHRYYVNGSASAGDVFFGGAWHTMLVGGLGHGGKGYFALDISDPDGAFNESNAGNIVKWEFTDAATPDDMGFSYGKATIAKMHDGSWAAIFGNGYNSVNENAVLYIVDIETGTIIEKIALGGSPANGLSTPAVVDTDGDFIADYIYAGDLKGNMWNIDVTSSNTNNWGSFYGTGGTAKPLFQARDGGGSIQPITGRPEIGAHPDGLDGVMVYFGTGKYLEDGDKTPTATPVHTFYGVWDEHPTSGNLGGGAPAAVTPSDLLAQTLTETTIGSVPVREVTDNPITWRPGTPPDHLGWRVDLPTTGEMSVSNPVLVGGGLPRIIFTTLIPESTAACAFGGSSWLMELNPQNGGRFDEPVFDVDDDGAFDNNDLIGGSGGIPPSGVKSTIGILPEPVIIQDTANNKIVKGLSGSTGAIDTNTQKGGSGKKGREGWRQLR